MTKEKKAASEPAPAPSDAPKRSIDFKWLPIDLLLPNAWNANTQDELTFNLLQDEIKEVGMIDPVEVVPLKDGNYLILGGEHRWRAAKNLNHEEIPCVLLTDAKWENDDLKKFVTVRMNAIRGKLDPDKFITLYNEMANKYGADSLQRLFGYADSRAFQKMLGWVKKGLKQSLPKEMASQVDEATKDVKSVEELGSIIQEMFNRYGDTLNQSFMIFTYGKQSHVYVAMDAKMRRSVDKALECCKLLKMDVNDFMRPIFNEFVKKAAIEIEKKQQEDAVSGSSPVADKKPEW